MRLRHAVFCQVVLSLVLGLAASGWAETTQCTVVASVPVTITTAGVYCLTSDLDYALVAGIAIRINASNVVLDFNGHTLRSLGGTATTAQGIYAGQRQNVTIKNGTVRGFSTGIWLSDTLPCTTAQGYLVEGMRVEGSASSGIEVDGQAGIVRHNQIVATGSSAQPFNTIGITLCGPGVRAIDNDVIRVTKQGAATSYGIWFCSSTVDAMAVGNRITTADQGIYMAFATVKYRDNLTINVALPYVLGTDAGNND
jgi:hypothetical protein